MINLVSTVDKDRHRWIPQFVEHYQKLGVDNFYISAHTDIRLPHDEKINIYRSLKEILLNLNVNWCGHANYLHNGTNRRIYDDQIQSQIDPNDWIIWADIDEFQEYWNDLKNVIKY